MFCEKCFVQYSRNFWFWLLENARNTVYSLHERIVSFSCFPVFFDVFRMFCVFCENTAKHSQNTAKHPQNITKHPQNITKHPQNTTKHHKTHLLTTQAEFANKPALAREGGGAVGGGARMRWTAAFRMDASEGGDVTGC